MRHTLPRTQTGLWLSNNFSLISKPFPICPIQLIHLFTPLHSSLFILPRLLSFSTPSIFMCYPLVSLGKKTAFFSLNSSFTDSTSSSPLCYDFNLTLKYLRHFKSSSRHLSFTPFFLSYVAQNLTTLRLFPTCGKHISRVKCCFALLELLQVVLLFHLVLACNPKYWLFLSHTSSPLSLQTALSVAYLLWRQLTWRCYPIHDSEYHSCALEVTDQK